MTSKALVSLPTRWQQRAESRVWRGPASASPQMRREAGLGAPHLPHLPASSPAPKSRDYSDWTGNGCAALIG